MEKVKQHIVTALVLNHSGVLTRISGLFSRRGYNIDSLSVCATQDPNLSRMTIVVNGDDYVLEQIVKQLDKLIDVHHVSKLQESTSVVRELLLIKLKVTPAQRPEIETITNIYKAKSVDLSPTTMVLEITGDGSKIDAFIEVVREYGIIEMARTGLTALQRGESFIKQQKDYNLEV